MESGSIDIWVEISLGEVADPDKGLVDGPFGSNLPASLYRNFGVPVIRGTNLSLGKERFKKENFVFVSEKTADDLARSTCKPYDIVFTKKGTIGRQE